MSKVFKGIKKAVKKVGKVIKKVAPYALMAAAAYFTAGAALSYFPATSGFVASMPGFGSGGIFTKTATFLGINGPATAANAAAGGGAMAGLGPLNNAAYATATGVSKSSLAGLGGSAVTGYGTTAVGTATGTTVAGVGKGSLKEATKQGLFSGMNIADKLLLAKTVTDVASGLMAEEPRDPRESFFGFNRDGEGIDLFKSDREPMSGEIDRRSVAEHYGRATPEFMPERTGADRQMEEYKQRTAGTADPYYDDDDEEEFV